MNTTTTPLALTADALTALPGVRHGFFGRRGGVSGGIYESLNAGAGSSDTAENVAENRARVAGAIGVAPDALITGHQVHSPEVAVVEGPWEGVAPQVDALVTRTPGLALGVLTADCGPVLLTDGEAGVIGAAHAGWRGALTGITDAVVEAMVGLGAEPYRTIAAIGPCIARISYEVGPEFVEQFMSADSENERFFTASASRAEAGKAHFDLPGYITARLATAGVGRIACLDADTYGDEKAWFSHRRSVHRGESDYGRNLSVIARFRPA